ncbi:MAG: DNA-protecting protein DprA [Ruminococcaceae bacterium]|nr:DNA-protecting protein DprA [Oscillospiraceae bacterium]
MERMEELLHWIWMAEALGAGSRLGIVLLREFGTIGKIYRQKAESVEKWKFLNRKEQNVAAEMLRHKSLEPAEKILQKCTELGIRLVHYEELGYPESLRSLPNAPLLLYYKGNLPLIDKRFTTAVVGTRKMSDYGRNMAYSMGYGLAAGGAVVISGMALGVDSMAMMGALDAGGITVGVLGCGVDIVYPREHVQVYRRILECGGCILSEYAPGTEPDGRHFPVRNRIISGLSDAGVVVEGDARSGSLITAKHLIYQGRKLFAVPGQVGVPGAEGPNNLIRDGALPAVTAEDILCEFTYMFPDSIHMGAAHQAYRRLNLENASRQTMSATGVGARNSRNYVGEGTYGGRNTVPEPPGDITSGSVTGVPAWIYAETAQAVSRSEAPVMPEAAREETVQAEQVPDTGKKKSVLEQLRENLRKQQNPETEQTAKTAGAKKTVKASTSGKTEKRQTEKSSQKDTEKIQPAHKKDTDMLDETELRVYNSMKPNVPMMPDELVANGFSIGQVMAAMTSLEMAGVIEAGSGGYFLRTDPDDLPVVLVEDTELEDNTRHD